MNRQIHKSLLYAMLMSVLGIASCGHNTEERPIFVFAAVGDPHIVQESAHGYDDPRYFKATTISLKLLRNAIEDINRYEPPVDFVLVLGDIADHGYLRELILAKGLLDSLEAPYYPVRGNHDARFDYWEEVFGDGYRNYAFDCKGFRFIVTDCSRNTSAGVEVGWTEETRDWVAADLRSHADKPAFFITHANLYPRTWSAAFDDRDVYGLHPGAVEVREILCSSGNLVAVISGHVHANCLEIHEGLPYVEVNANCIARASVRYFHVYPDRTEMTYRHLSNDSLQTYAEAVARRSPRVDDVAAALSLIDGGEDDKKAVLAYPIMPAESGAGEADILEP